LKWIEYNFEDKEFSFQSIVYDAFLDLYKKNEFVENKCSNLYHSTLFYKNKNLKIKLFANLLDFKNV